MKKQKKDSSPIVPQRDKLKTALDIYAFPWTPRQKELLSIMQHKDTNIVFVTGPAGSTKTLLSAYASLVLLNEHRISDVLYIRSAVESSDNKLGFLPGDVDEKMSVYGIPLLEKLEELLPKSQVKALLLDKRAVVMPVNFARGQSWNARIAIIDEAQNITQKDLYTLLTRLGKFSKAFVLADPSQSDINGKGGGFERLRDHFAKPQGSTRGIYRFELESTDILRSDLVRYLVEEYAKLPK